MLNLERPTLGLFVGQFFIIFSLTEPSKSIAYRLVAEGEIAGFKAGVLWTFGSNNIRTWISQQKNSRQQ